jgi:hypothetical protein
MKTAEKTRFSGDRFSDAAEKNLFDRRRENYDRLRQFAGNYQVIRVLPNGAPDPSFNVYTYSITHIGGTAIQRTAVF